MDTTTILVWASLALAPQTPKVPTSGDDFFVGKGQTDKAPRDMASWRRELARVQLLLEVDGQVKEARAEALKLWAELVDSPSSGHRHIALLETLDLLTRILVAGGERELAASYFDASRQPASLRNEYVMLATNPRLAEIRARLEVVSSQSGVDAERIDRLVFKALREGQTAVIAELGVAAAPALETRVRDEPEELPVHDKDALPLLFACAPERAATFSLELLKAPNTGFLFAKRVLRALASSKMSLLGGAPSAFRFEGAGSEVTPVLVEPVWRDLVTELLREPLVAGEALEYATRFVALDALDEPMRRAFIAYGESAEPDADNLVARSLTNRAGLRSSAGPLLEAMLRSNAVELRIAAAGELARERRSAALLARVDDPEPAVRRAVAQSLQVARLELVWFTPGGVGFQPVNPAVSRTFQPEDRPILDRLLADENALVRATALRTATSAGLRLDAAAAARFLADSDPQVRTAVMTVLPAEPDVAAPLFERALADSMIQVRDAARTELYTRFGVIRDPQGNTTVSEVAIPWSAALREVAVHEVVTLSGSHMASTLRWRVARLLARTPEDARALVRGIVDTADVDSSIATNTEQVFGPEKGNEPGFWRMLDAEHIEALLRKIHAVAPGDLDVAQSLQRSERPADLRAGIVRVVLDPAISRRFRMALLPVLREESNLASLVVRVATEPGWSADEDGNLLREAWKNALRSGLPPGALIAAVAPVLDAAVPDEIVALLIASSLRGLSAGPTGSSRRILERFHTAPGVEATASADWALRAEAEQGRWDVVRTVLADPNSRSRASAVSTIARLRPPEGLAWLAVALHDPMQAGGDGVRVASAIAGYLSEEAAEILLRGAELAPNAEVRKAALDGVAEIRAFLDQKASWRQRTSGAQQRDAAVAELAAMLDSKDAVQRAQAARGLATLEGVEHLPRLVRMLQDPDASVRKAVQESLDRLNGPR